MSGNDSSLELIDVCLVDEELFMINAEKLLSEAGENISKRGDALGMICRQLYDMKDPIRETMYVQELSTRFKLPRKMFTEKIKDLRESAKEMLLGPADEPIEGIDEKLFKKLGFITLKGRYYFQTSGNTWFKASNFIMKPLYHLYSKMDNKRLVEITNEYGFTRILEIPSKNFISVDQFQMAVYAEGNYIFFGSKVHYMRIIESISPEFRIANELKTLGWQREGFYAFANGIFNGTWQPVDELGMTTHKKNTYFSPAFSTVYADVREDDDEYENDRYFVWKQSEIPFSTWCRMMIDVYGEKAIVAIAFLIASSFRDLIYDKYKIFPHLFLFGEKQSGKSQLAWSLSNAFFNNMPAFNLNSGTQVGFFRRLSRVKNCLCWFDEYTNDIDEKRFQSLKSAYDGMGHEKGKMTKDSRTEITKVNSACIISSQYLPTRDDNALYTRSIPLIFERKKYSDDEIHNYDKLKSHELKGLSSIIGEVLKYREDIDVNYGMTFSVILDQLKNDLLDNKIPFDERLLRNFVSILTPIHIILNTTDPLDLSFTWNQIYDLSRKMIGDQSVQISSSEAISTFWNMVEFLLDKGLIKENIDFKISTINHGLKVIDKTNKEVNLDFSGSPRRLLFIRLSKIHPLYLESHRQQTGKNGIDMVSLLHYFKSHPSYLGTQSSTRFDNSVTYSYVFSYNELRVNLLREINIQGDLSVGNPEDGLPF